MPPLLLQPRESAGESQPRGNLILFLLTISVFINYIDRSNLSIAAPLIKDEMGISASQLGVLLSAFFWIYAFLQIPSGWLVDRFDVKFVFGAGFFLWSAATAVTGILHGFIALLIVRVILGVGESVAFPSYCKILGGCFQESRRGFANSMIMMGLALGPALGMLLGGSAVSRFGWRPFFILLGSVGLLWLVPWSIWMPRRSSSYKPTASQGAGFLPILRQPAFWGTCIGQSAINFFLYFLVTWLPFYLVRGRHFSLETMAELGGIVFLMSAISSAVSGKLSDRWICAGASPSLVRKGFMVFGHIGFGIFLMLAALTSGRVFIASLALTGAFLGITICNSWAIPQTLAGPRMIGRWIGLENFVANVVGASAPVITGFLLDRTGSFFWPFVVTATVAWIGALGWSFAVGPLNEIDWARSSRETFPAPAFLSSQSTQP